MGQLFSKSTQTETDDDETFYSLDETPAVEVAFLKTKSKSVKFQSTKTDTGEIPAEEVAELRTKVELQVPIDQKAQTSNFRKSFGGFLSRSHEGKTVNNSTFAHLDSNSILVLYFL